MNLLCVASSGIRIEYLVISNWHRIVKETINKADIFTFMVFWVEQNGVMPRLQENIIMQIWLYLNTLRNFPRQFDQFLSYYMSNKIRCLQTYVHIAYLTWFHLWEKSEDVFHSFWVALIMKAIFFLLFPCIITNFLVCAQQSCK